MVWEVEEESAWVRAVEIGGNYATVLHILLLKKGFRENPRKIRKERGMQSSCTLYETWEVWTPL